MIKNNVFQIVDFREGVISNSNAKILVNSSLEDQLFNLVEDIIQVYYVFSPDLKYTIDIGWKYEDFEVNLESHFLVRIVENSFPNVIFKKKCKTIKELILILEQSVQYIYNLDATPDGEIETT